MDLDLNTKLVGIKRTFNFGVSPEAGATRYQCSAEVDFSETTIGDLLDSWARKSIVVAIQNNNLRKKGEEFLSDPENRTVKGKLHDLTKSTPKAVVDIANVPAEVLWEKSQDKDGLKRMAIEQMVKDGQARWVDEDELKFELV